MKRITDVIGPNFPQFNMVSPATTVKDALYKMYCEHVDYLIVQENGKFIGLLTEYDVAGKVLLSEKSLHNTSVSEFMTTDIPVVTADDTLEYSIQLLDRYGARYLALYDNFDFKAIISAQDLLRLALQKQYSGFENSGQQEKYAWVY